jgi:hypothetical protein
MKLLLPVAILVLGTAGRLGAQTSDSLPRRLTAAETVCESIRPPATDSVYDAEAVDRPVEAIREPARLGGKPVRWADRVITE